ncbi:hypothetical protein Tco_0903520, partial [Tanacetum coccineum]
TAHTQLAMPPGLSARVTNAMTLSPSSFQREELKDEGPNSEGEEAAPEGQQHQAASIEVTTIDRPLGIRYGVARRRALELAKEVADETPTPRIPARTTWIDPQDALQVTTPAATIIVDEDEFLEVGAQLEIHRSILHDHTQRLDALPPTLLEGHGRDIIELFDRSRAVREEIHS